jgi:hypothetical protein
MIKSRLLAMFLLCFTGAGAAAQSKHTLTRVARVDGDAADLTAISWLSFSPSGNIIALQSMDGLAKEFSSAGKLVRTIGRKGSGPGEFRLLGLGGWTADTLWLYDTELDRITLFAKTGKLIRVDRVPGISPQASVVLPPTGYSYPVARPAEFLLREAGPAQRPKNGQMNGSGAWILTDLKGKAVRVVALRPVVETSLPVTYKDGRGIAPIPFVHKSASAVSPNGSLLASIWSDTKTWKAYSIALFSIKDGKRLYQVDIPFQGSKVTKRMADSAIAKSMIGVRHPEVRKALDTDARRRIPPVLSPVTSAFVDDAGRVWVGLRPDSGTQDWMIVDTKGRVSARLSTPRNVRLVSAQGNSVAGVETDEDGIESIVIYRLSPGR